MTVYDKLILTDKCRGEGDLKKNAKKIILSTDLMRVLQQYHSSWIDVKVAYY